ncbi:MAG: DUF1667 domain-containing protein [Lentihominibacter sp.]
MRIIVIGGGPAGMAAAVSAKERGIENVTLLERHDYLGGVLPQCIHNGFGTQLYEKDYTGGEYAWLWKEKTELAGVEVMLNTTVLSVTGKEAEKGCGGWLVKCVSAKLGARELEADTVIIATGCRERTLPQMLIPGSRPAGVFTAGAAQLMMNMKNYLPGRSAVILGSGDIGLIMARRMTLEGINVRMILGQEATGLARNIVQCVEDYDIPMRYGWTVVSTHGYERLKGVTIAPFDEDGRPDRTRSQYIQCDTLLVATGLIPELEICHGMDVNDLQSSGLFICGNANRVHDLADHVTEEGTDIGRQAAEYLVKGTSDSFSGISGRRPELTGKQGNMICTVCPKGCIMQVERVPFAVSGNQCDRGESFAKQELESPKRVVTAIVKAGDSTVSVRTDRPIDKADIFKVMKAVKRITAATPVVPGQVVASDIAGTGADLVATWYA